MKKLLTLPVRAAWHAVVLPVKVLMASLGLTFRAGFAVGKLPVKGGAVVSRALGWKIIGALTVGLVIGLVLGRRLGAMGHDHDHGAERAGQDDPGVTSTGAAA